MTQDEYEDKILRLDVQRQIALNNNDLKTHNEIIGEMIKLSNEKISKRYAIKRENHIRSNANEKE